VLRGVHALNLDVKGRLAIPSKFREHLSVLCDGKLVVTIDRDHCLLLYPKPAWELLEAKLAAMPNMDAQTRGLQRMLIGHATECDMDGNHRILLPPLLREFAGLKKKAVMLGQGNKIEIWDEQRWAKGRDDFLEAQKGEARLSEALESLSL